MNKPRVTHLVQSSVIGVVLAALAISPAYACHPVGTINKSVEDLTTGSALVDANDDSTALSVNSGDTLEYVITVSNTAAQADNNQNDMVNTVVTDTLPSGVQYISDPSETSITDNVGTIAAGKSVTITYEVKVTSTQNGTYLTNTACFTANSVNNNDPQSGSDTAVVLVNVPTPTPAPTPAPTPTTPAPAAPTALPNTGPGNYIVPSAVLVSVLGYAGYMFRLKRHAAR